MKEVPLTQGKVALVDDEDYEELNKFKWHSCKHGNTFYAKRTTVRPNQRAIGMHRHIMGFPVGFQVDHIDGDGLNNQKFNLRICTASQNQMNHKIRKDNTTGFIGVSFHGRDRMFYAQIQANKKHINLGYFNSSIEAAASYDAAAIKLHGEFARLNFNEKYYQGIN